MKSSTQRRLNNYAPRILFIGIILCVCGLLFMSLCTPNDRITTIPDHSTAHREQSLWPDLFSNQLQRTTYMVVLVLCGPKARERRDTIRETWLSNLPRDVVKFFAIGTKALSPDDIAHLRSEDQLHQDLLLLTDVQDHYSLLTEKLVSAFSWLDHNIDYKFVFKADDDTFARVDILYDAVSLQYSKESMLYWGFFTGDAHVLRKGVWAETKWDLCDRYLPYARGGGYILSASLVHYIVLNSRVLQFYNSEDVSVGAWLSALKVHRIHDPRFDTEYKSRGCHNQYIVTHKQSLQKMREKFDNLQTTGQLCTQEVRYRNSYVYNWRVAPSMCCLRNDSSVP